MTSKQRSNLYSHCCINIIAKRLNKLYNQYINPKVISTWRPLASFYSISLGVPCIESVRDKTIFYIIKCIQISLNELAHLSNINSTYICILKLSIGTTSPWSQHIKIKHFDYVMLNRTTSLHVFQGENAIIIFLINTYGIFIDCFRSCPISPLPIHFYKSFKIIIQLSRWYLTM